MASLPEDPETAEPCIDPGRPPSVAVSTQQQLVPIATTFVATHYRTERRTRRIRDRCTIRLGTRRVSQRLTLEIAAIADQLSEEDQMLVRPAQRLAWLRQGSGSPYPLAHGHILDSPPPSAA